MSLACHSRATIYNKLYLQALCISIVTSQHHIVSTSSVLDHEQPTHIVPRLDGSAGTCGVSTDMTCISSADHKSTPLQRLQREVQELHHKLAARDHEIHSLKEIAEAVKELQSQDAQAAKVIELSKKVKALVPMPQGTADAPSMLTGLMDTMALFLLSAAAAAQNRQLNLYYEKEKQKVARLQQSLSELTAHTKGVSVQPYPILASSTQFWPPLSSCEVSRTCHPQ